MRNSKLIVRLDDEAIANGERYELLVNPNMYPEELEIMISKAVKYILEWEKDKF